MISNIDFFPIKFRKIKNEPFFVLWYFDSNGVERVTLLTLIGGVYYKVPLSDYTQFFDYSDNEIYFETEGIYYETPNVLGVFPNEYGFDEFLNNSNAFYNRLSVAAPPAPPAPPGPPGPPGHPTQPPTNPPFPKKKNSLKNNDATTNTANFENGDDSSTLKKDTVLFVPYIDSNNKIKLDSLYKYDACVWDSSVTEFPIYSFANYTVSSDSIIQLMFMYELEARIQQEKMKNPHKSNFRIKFVFYSKEYSLYIHKAYDHVFSMMSSLNKETGGINVVTNDEGLECENSGDNGALAITNYRAAFDGACVDYYPIYGYNYKDELIRDAALVPDERKIGV